MTIILRQSTASQEIPMGYFLDSGDGDSEETGLTIANTDIKLWKSGATTLANKNSGGGTHISNGIYYATLDATDTNTIGPLVIFCHVSGALATKVECVVLDEAVYDVLFGTTAPSTYAGGDTSGVTTLLSRVVGTLASGTHNAQSGDSYARLGAPAGASVSADVAAVKAQTAAIEVDTQDLQTQVGTDGAGLTALPWNAAWDAEVQSEAQDAITASALATAANLATLAGYVDTEVAAILAAVDTEVAAIKTKTDYLPSATAGAAGGVFIAGTNAATSITTALTANITGNLSGSVGSVTGAVGSVTGAVGSVTGAVGSVAGNVGGNVAGSVASVTGNVGGSVASVAANGITATSIAADAINAAAVKADAVTKIQSGLATPTNITAGTITTVTNLTNAPTSGDLTATMKTSVQTAAAAALTAYDPPTNAEMEARTLVAASYATASALDAVDNFIDTEVAAIKAVADKLDTAIELDGAVYRFTVNALELAPTGGSAPSAADIRAEIDANSTQLAAIVEDTGTTLPASLATIAGYIDTEVAAILAAVDTEVAAILADTNELQTDLVNGGRLDLLIDAIKAKTDNLPTDPADQSAVEAAITAATSGLATAANLATLAGYVDTEVAAILADTNELQTDWANGGRLDLILDARASQTSVDDLPTNSELATALAGADDAVLSAIAALPTDADVQTAAAAALTAYDPPTNAEMEARTLAAASYATASALDTVDNFIDTEVAAIKAVTDKLDTALELDGAVYRYTTNALEQAPTGGGTAPTVEEIRAEIDANSTQLAAIVADTNELQTDLVNGGRLDLLIDAIKAKTDNLPTDPADQSAVEAAITSATSGLSTLNAAGVRSAVGLASANLDTQLGDLPTNSELVTALAAADDATLAAIAALPTDADVQTAAAAALTAYDPPTKAELDSGLAALNDLDAAGVRAAVGLAAANLDTQLADLPTNSELTTALGDIEVTAVVEAQTIADAMAMATDVVPEDNSPLAYLEDILEDTGTTLQAALAGAGATVTIVSAVDGGDIEVFSGDTWEFTISSSALSLSKYEALGLVVKRTQSQTDNEALLYLRTGASGLQRINGAAPISTANGTLTNTATSFTGKVAMLETDGVTPRANYAWWLKGFDTTPDPDEGFTLATGKFTITPAGLQAIA